MTSYRAQVETSADGQIWQAIAAAEIVDIGATQPGDWFDAREAAQEAGATIGTHVRILVWPADYDGYGTTHGTTHGTVHVAEYTVPSLYTWAQISELTGFSAADVDALVAEWIAEDGYLDSNHQSTQATLDLLIDQAGTTLDSLTRLGQARAAALRGQEVRTGLLRQAVATAMTQPGANESAIARAAGVDRMTVRAWAGKR